MKNRMNLQKLTVVAVTLSLALFTFGLVTAAAQECPAGQQSTPQGCVGPPSSALYVVTGQCSGPRQIIGATNNATSPSIGFIYSSASSQCPIELECLYKYGGPPAKTYILYPGQSLVIFACDNYTILMGVEAIFQVTYGRYSISIGAIG
jgi:hypothetical protein